jgi:hypothetical protein
MQQPDAEFYTEEEEEIKTQTRISIYTANTTITNTD